MRSSMKTAKFILIPFCVFAVAFSGCSIKLGPDPVTSFERAEAGLVRMGEVTETMTGTWAQLPGRYGFKSALLDALKKPEVAPLFEGGASNLIMDISLTSDHEDDGARLTGLGALSLITIGIIPLSYHSEWNVSCKLTLKNSEGNQVAVYNLNEKGTYDIQAYPLTILAFCGSWASGPSDGKEIFKRVAANLADKIVRTLQKDSRALVSQGGMGGAAPAGSFSSLQKNTII